MAEETKTAVSDSRFVNIKQLARVQKELMIQRLASVDDTQAWMQLKNMESLLSSFNTMSILQLVGARGRLITDAVVYIEGTVHGITADAKGNCYAICSKSRTSPFRVVRVSPGGAMTTIISDLDRKAVQGFNGIACTRTGDDSSIVLCVSGSLETYSLDGTPKGPLMKCEGRVTLQDNTAVMYKTVQEMGMDGKTFVYRVHFLDNGKKTEEQRIAENCQDDECFRPDILFDCQGRAKIEISDSEAEDLGPENAYFGKIVGNMSLMYQGRLSVGPGNQFWIAIDAGRLSGEHSSVVGIYEVSA